MASKNKGQDPCSEIAAKAKAAHAGAAKSKALEGVPSWDTFDALKVVDFETVMIERQAVKAAEDAAIKHRKELDAQLQSYLYVVGQKAVAWKDHKVQIVPSKAADTVSPVLLVQKGVSVDVVVECTVLGKEYEYVLVTPPKKEASDE